LASIDPAALDSWAAKHLLYPIDDSREPHPDKFTPLNPHLIQAKNVTSSKDASEGRR